MTLRCFFTGHTYSSIEVYTRLSTDGWTKIIHVISHCSRCGKTHHAREKKGS